MFADGVMESSDTLGTDDYILTGSIYNGLTFSQRFVDEQEVAFIVQTLNRSKFEIIKGSFDVGPPRKLRRTQVLSSSAAGAKIDWTVDDEYYIASFASADALSGFGLSNLDIARPWWVRFGSWVRKNFPSTGLHTWNFWDGAADIPIGIIDTVNHKINWAFAMPAGMVFDYAGTVAPPNTMLCLGQSLLRSDYPKLFAAIGVQYGAADGTHFNVPNTQGRVKVGMDHGGSGLTNPYLAIATLGATGGSALFPSQNIHVNGTTTGANSGDNTYEGNMSNGTGNFTTFAQSHHFHTIPALTVNADGTLPEIPNVQHSIVMNQIITLGT